MTVRAVHVIGGGDTGGAMAHVLPLLSALRDEECDARLLCLGDGGLAEEADRRGLPVDVLPMDSPWDARVMRPLLGRLARSGWDVVHTHGMRANLPVRAVWPALTFREPTRPCLFTTVHSDLALDYASGAQAWFYRLLDLSTRPVVDQVVFVSAELAERTSGSARPLVIPSGVEVAADVPEDTGRRAAPPVSRTVWGGEPPPDETPRVGTVSRLVGVKDLSLFLEVVARLRDTVPGLRVAVVGDGPERAALVAYARELDLEETVTFSGEVRPGTEVVREFDVFLLTSRSEGLPIAVLEAMAAGVPVVATAVGGVSEAVQDGITGYLEGRGEGSSARLETVAGLAEKTAKLLDDSAPRKAMGEVAALTVRRYFSVRATARATLRAYERCLAGRRDPTSSGGTDRKGTRGGGARR